MAFSVASFFFEFEAVTPILLPDYSGSTFRGGFGTAFKRTVCIYKTGDCQKCPYGEKCAYLYVFETPIDDLKEELNLSGNAPHPFVLEPEYNGMNEIKPEGKFGLTLNLIGKGLEYLPFFVFTFIKLGEIGIGKGRGKYILTAVYSLNGDKKKIYSAETGYLKKTFHSIFWQGIGEKPFETETNQLIKVEFITPTRIQKQGRYTDDIAFEILITNLLRRLKFLDLVHGNGELCYDHKAWIQMAKSVKILDKQLKWNDWRRYSHRQKSKIFMGGVEGSIIYKGAIHPYLELLDIGTKIHVGKATSFGMGRYKITQV